MDRTCTVCRQNFTISDRDRAYYDQIQVPAPTKCPNCRLIRRLHERNTKKPYYRTCSFSGKKILSQYAAEVPFPVYEGEVWWSDQWDPLSYGRDFDFNRPFFEQFKELKNTVPHLALFNTIGTLENSEFNTCTAYLKNCYLLAESDYCEDCYYSNLLKHSQNCIDCSICYEDEVCYECIDCQKCYRLFYSQDCMSCQDSYFLKNCHNVTDSIGCINIRRGQYLIFNKQYSKEDYENMKVDFKLDTHQGIDALKKKTEEFFSTQPQQHLIEEHNENSFGDHLFNSKNAWYCFDSKDLEDCTYCFRVSLGVKSSMDYTSWGDKAELVYESSSCGDHVYNLKFCTMCWTNCQNLTYCDGCFSSSDLFGCVGVRRKKYCILNKQYSKEDYELLMPKIIEHMRKTGEYGEFFPQDVAPLAYNESLVMDCFPLEKEQALALGYRWKDEPLIDHTSDHLICESCGKNYAFIEQELAFYKTHNLPPPLKCFACRHRTRVANRTMPAIYEYPCSRCSELMYTGYQPDSGLTILCKKCYLQEVY